MLLFYISAVQICLYCENYFDNGLILVFRYLEHTAQATVASKLPKLKLIFFPLILATMKPSSTTPKPTTHVPHVSTHVPPVTSQSTPAPHISTMNPPVETTTGM